jgi:hypothetical protein
MGLSKPGQIDIDCFRKQLAKFIEATQEWDKLAVKQRLECFAIQYPYPSLVLWVAVIFDGRFLAGPTLDRWPFVWEQGEKRLEVHFRMDVPFCSYVEARVKDPRMEQGEGYRRLLFHQNNWVDGFLVRVYASREEALGAEEDFIRPVNPALPQGQKPT